MNLKIKYLDSTTKLIRNTENKTYLRVTPAKYRQHKTTAQTAQVLQPINYRKKQM